MSELVLVVEDDTAIRVGICEKLHVEGYETAVAVDGEDAIAWLDERCPDLVVLDLMLPKLDGYTVLRRLRKRYADLPVLILSARGSEDEKVEGLRAGADDYLAKPFGLKELVARIEVLLRRTRGSGEELRHGDLLVRTDPPTVERDGDEVLLSRKEQEILFHLVRHRRRVVSRQELLEAAWGFDVASDERAVDFHILNLRRKLEVDPKEPRVIVTRHGLGYQFRASAE